MKTDIVITFDIYQDTLDKQKPNFTIYAEKFPDNPNSFNLEELQKSELREIAIVKPAEKDYSEKFARKYIIRLPHEKIQGWLKEYKIC